MKTETRNHYCFGLGTIGRDMQYALISMYLIFFLTDVLQLPDRTMWWVTGIILFARIFDAVNDPFMGVIVDNTKTRWGKFKPWITAGALISGLLTALLFVDTGLRGAPFIIFFAAAYLMWGISFTMNDIAYWSMMPSLSMDQKGREKLGAFARICANIGLFVVVAGIVPITEALRKATGSMSRAYSIFAFAIVLILIAGQAITLFGVKENRKIFKSESTTSLSELVTVIFKNDQLLFTSIAMVLFMIGYVTTTSFGLYFFKYAYGDENMYSIFAVILGVSQVLALSVFPLFSKRYDRRTLYTWGTAMVLVGYIIFFFSPMDMRFIGTAGILLFLGQAFIQLLMLMFLADTIEYGQWKLGKRNESVTFALQPFINKMGGAIGTGIVGAVVILSGINKAAGPEDVSEGGLLMMKIAMLAVPPVLIAAGYWVYRRWYRIDADFYDSIVRDLKSRGDLLMES
ncbi:MAG: glycoside-pentoside-hexuronide (GPH):cation symporter [Spirochaetales bacterium]|nr:glycoside-pentoside-hexuronide (GPH):cation symporter [Spirochaetales bacterium]